MRALPVFMTRASKTPIHKRISDLMRGVFKVDPPIIEAEDPVILIGSLIRNHEAHFFPASEEIPPLKLELPNITLHPAFGGFGVLKALANSYPSEYYKTLWRRSAEVPTWIGSCDYQQPFDDILRAFSETKFGGARLTSEGRQALVTLSDAVGLIREGRLSAKMPTEEVSSVPIPVSKSEPIIGAIRQMIALNVRRLFLKKGQGKFISDRTVIDYIFSPQRLEVARDHPELWLSEEVEKVDTKVPARCKAGGLDAAARDMGPEPDDCLMTDEFRLISRWDLVVKPWRMGKLEALGN